MSQFAPRGLIAALQFLTRIPVPELRDFTNQDAQKAAAWYPVAGVMVGLCVACAAWLGTLSSPWVAALLGVIAWTWVTGALHLDGLADVADGLGAAHGAPDRFLEVAKDPRLGSFGAIILFLVLAAKLVLMAELTAGVPPMTWLPALTILPAWARWGPLVWRNLVAPLGHGRGRNFADSNTENGSNAWLSVAAHGILLAGITFHFAPALLVCLLTTPLIAFFWRWRLGGMTGDCHGASIEVTEVLLLGALVALGGTAA